jgi:hypothetical protein
MRINCLSNTFSHDFGSTAGKKPKNITWDFFSKKNSISLYIDGDVMKGIFDKNDGKLKFLWLFESRHFANNSISFVKSNLDWVLSTYELIFTHDVSLLSLSDKFVWVPANGTWIKEFKNREKTKLCSMIVSSKTFTDNQKKRLEFAKTNKNNLDLYGTEFNHIKNKEEGLNDYFYSVCFENDIYDTYFTEKILDCFATKTIPIYSGTKKISEHFDNKSIIFIDENFDLKNLNEDFYYSNLESVNKNFELSKEYDILDDWLYKNFLNLYN